MPIKYFVAGIVLAFGLAGCGDDDARPSDAGPGDSGPVGDSGGRTDSGPRPDAGGGGDGNDSFAEAVMVTVGDPDGVDGVIDPPGDFDYYRFDGTAGDWVVIATDANPDDDTMMVDTVITLYDSLMTQIAENDDRVPRTDTDSEIVIRLPETGTYFIELQEWSTWDPASTMTEGDPSFAYNLVVLTMDPAGMGLVEDPETGDDAASATALEYNPNAGFVIGDFRDNTDVDVYTMTVTGGMANASVQIMPSGVDGYGSTTSAGNMWITDASGATVIARVDNTVTGFDEVSPSLADGDYLFWLEHPGGAAGSNDFYVLKHSRGTENDPEGDDAGNGTLAGAEALSQMDVDGINRAFILSHLSSDTDVDYYSFAVAAGEQVTVVCGSASSGSGVQGLHVEVRDDTDTMVAMANEAPPDTAYIEDAGITTAGTFYLRLSKTGQDAEVTGDWVRCGVAASVPTTP